MNTFQKENQFENSAFERVYNLCGNSILHPRAGYHTPAVLSYYRETRYFPSFTKRIRHYFLRASEVFCTSRGCAGGRCGGCDITLVTWPRGWRLFTNWPGPGDSFSVCWSPPRARTVGPRHQSVLSRLWNDFIPYQLRINKQSIIETLSHSPLLSALTRSGGLWREIKRNVGN